jgi:hypothetical protein
MIMKNLFLVLSIITASAASLSAQEMNSKGQPVHKSEQNAPVALKPGQKITRGAALSGKTQLLTIAKAFATPEKVSGKTYRVEGVIVRSCKKEGCWLEMADMQGGKSVRVTFGDHAFFIPLNSGGMKVRAEGRFVTKVLPKEHVDHLIKDDGARFDRRNADGTVTEVSFEATGVELIKT